MKSVIGETETLRLETQKSRAKKIFTYIMEPIRERERKSPYTPILSHLDKSHSLYSFVMPPETSVIHCHNNQMIPLIYPVHMHYIIK